MRTPEEITAELVEQTIRMRKCQKECFKHKMARDLVESKNVEARVDRLIVELHESTVAKELSGRGVHDDLPY
jgi:hypothetical protein